MAASATGRFEGDLRGRGVQPFVAPATEGCAPQNVETQGVGWEANATFRPWLSIAAALPEHGAGAGDQTTVWRG
jgi:hypothetical protein